MALRPLTDLGPAEWLVRDAGTASDLVSCGPSGFDAQVRILHARTDGDDGERLEGCLESAQLAALIDVLTTHTTSAANCLHALWDGFGEIEGGAPTGFLTAFAGSIAYARLWRQGTEQPPPAFPAAVLNGPRLHLGDRSYLLFGGALADAGQWGARPYDIDIPRDINSPNLLWPADHAWFVATDVDKSWTGVVGSEDLAWDLLADPRLEVVRAGGSA